MQLDGYLDATKNADIKKEGLVYGLSIGRRAPLHRLHLDCILEIDRAGLVPVIVIGSVNGVDDAAFYDPLRNPLTVEQQKEQLRLALPPEVYARCKILTLPDHADDGVWMRNLVDLCRRNGIDPAKTAMHFRAKSADAKAVEDGHAAPLSHYKRDLLRAGFSVWQSYNLNPADDVVNASDIRRLPVGKLGESAAQAASWLATEVARARKSNPHGGLLDAAGIPQTILDITLARLSSEAGVTTKSLLSECRKLGRVDFTTLEAVTATTICQARQKPMVMVGPRMGREIGGYFKQNADYDFIPASVGFFQSGESFSELYYGDEASFEKNAKRLKGARVFVVQSNAPPVGDNTQHMLQMIHTLKAYGVAEVTAVVPFAAYARQDRAFGGRFASISADLLPKQLKAAGADKVVTVTVHSKAAAQFYRAAFGRGFSHVSTSSLFAEHLSTNLGIDAANIVSGAPDGGEKPKDQGIARARNFDKALRGRFNKAAMFKISKVHTAESDTKVTAFDGKVAGKTAVVIDDMVDGGSTLINAARVLRDNGASQVICCVTHAILSERGTPALEKLLANDEAGRPVIDRLVVTDSIPEVRLKVAALRPDLAARVDILPLAPLLDSEMKKVSAFKRTR